MIETGNKKHKTKHPTDSTFQKQNTVHVFSFSERERNLHKITRGVKCKNTRGVQCKTLEVYNAKHLEVFVYQIFTGGDMLIIPNIELM